MFPKDVANFVDILGWLNGGVKKELMNPACPCGYCTALLRSEGTQATNVRLVPRKPDPRLPSMTREAQFPDRAAA